MRRSAPRYNPYTEETKANDLLSREEKTLRHIGNVTQDRLTMYRKALCNGRTIYYSTLIGQYRILFSILISLTLSQSSFESCIPSSLCSNDFMNLIIIKIVYIREILNRP